MCGLAHAREPTNWTRSVLYLLRTSQTLLLRLLLPSGWMTVHALIVAQIAGERVRHLNVFLHIPTTLATHDDAGITMHACVCCRVQTKRLPMCGFHACLSVCRVHAEKVNSRMHFRVCHCRYWHDDRCVSRRVRAKRRGIDRDGERKVACTVTSVRSGNLCSTEWFLGICCIPTYII